MLDLYAEQFIESPSISIIIPTFNGAKRIGNCLDALADQARRRRAEILVVNDGSTDQTARLVGEYAQVTLINQSNAGPAAARNHGARSAKGSILLFTDDDCVPTPAWIDAMLAPFADPAVVGSKGTYRTHQRELAARFVQLEYEDRYRIMAHLPEIDFVDTYSAAFRRDKFLEMGGYDTSFPVACAEDIELSYRMAARGWKMRFVPDAIVFHTHPASFANYLRKKYKFAYWRMLAVRKNPSKGVKDSHTPQLMKLQLLLLPALCASLLIDAALRMRVPATAMTVGLFLISTLPFTMRALRRDPIVGLLCPVLLAARSTAQFFGVTAGLLNAWRHPVTIASEPRA